MTGVDSGIAERDVENAKGALFGYLELSRALQRLVVLAPLDFGAIVPLHRTLDLHLGAEEHHSGTAHLECDLGLLGIVLDVCRVIDLDDGLGILRRTGLHIARLLVRRLRARTHRLWPLDLVLLRHDLLALHLAILEPVPAGVGALGPLAHLPANWTVKHVAVLPVCRRWLGAHAVRHHHGVLAPAGDLVDALHLASLDANAAAFGAGRVVRVVPPGRAGTVVAGANPRFGLGFRRAEEG